MQQASLNCKQMIQEFPDNQQRSKIKLGESPVRHLSQRVMEVLSPSSGSEKGDFMPRDLRRCSSHQIFPIVKMEEEKEIKSSINLGKCFVNEDMKTKIKKTNKTKRIIKSQRIQTRSQRHQARGQKDEPGTVKIENIGQIDSLVKLEAEDDICYHQQQFPSERSLKQRPHQYSIKSYQEKLKIVEIAAIKGNIYASKKFDVSLNNIHRWKISCKRRPGAGRKINDPGMERALTQWIQGFQAKYGAIPQRKDIREKAVKLSRYQGFQASKGWYERYMERHPAFRSMAKFGCSRQRPVPQHSGSSHSRSSSIIVNPSPSVSESVFQSSEGDCASEVKKEEPTPIHKYQMEVEIPVNTTQPASLHLLRQLDRMRIREPVDSERKDDRDS